MRERSILIVEDDPGLCDVLDAFLRGEGYRVFSSGTAAEALRLAGERRPAVVLIDLRLPDGRGTDLLSKLKMMDPDCVCMIMTGHPDVESAVAALEEGAFHYVRKPLQLPRLAKHMERVFELIHLKEEQYRAEEELRMRSQESEDRYLALVEEASDGVLIIQDEAIVFANRASAEAVGYSVEEVVGSNYLDFIMLDDREKVSEKYRVMMDGGPIPQTVEYRAMGRDGILKEFEVSSVRIQHEGRPAVMAMSRDVTERKRVEDELRRAKEEAEAANRAKSDFLTNMGHELRTPLTGIMGMAELLLGTDMDSRWKKYVLAILRSGRALLDIMNDLLDMSKIEAGKLNIEPVAFDLKLAVEEVVEILTTRASEKGLELTVRYADDVPRRLVGDAGRIRQVLINLVDNAIKFTDRGRVTVSLDCGERTENTARVRLSVKDTGIGIPAGKTERIFEKFTQGDASYTRRHGGAGLGLPICRQLVELMGGTMGMESHPGVSSDFWFYLTLPLQTDKGAQTDAGKAIREAEPPRTSHHLPAQVLVVEDNDINQEVAATILRKLGCRVEVARDGKEAVEMTGRKPYDVIFMDCSMPGMDGFEATAEIRRMEASNGQRCAIVAMTAHSLDEDRARCLDAGMDDYIAKPASMDDFHSVLQRFWPGGNPLPT